MKEKRNCDSKTGEKERNLKVENNRKIVKSQEIHFFSLPPFCSERAFIVLEMAEFTPEQVLQLQNMVTAAVAAAQPQAPPVAPQADMAAAAAAAVAAVAPAVAAVEVNAISHTFPPFWPEDVEGFFTAFEAACANKKITQDGSKYSKLVSVLTQEARSRICLLYTSPSPRDLSTSRMPSSA